MRYWTVGIIGGGPGGLFTAYYLQSMANARYHVTMLEASERFGGKILTPRFDGSPATYEAGAAEIYDYSPVGPDPLKELIVELGLSTNPIGGSAVIMEDRVLTNLDDVRDYLGEEVSAGVMAFDRAAKDWMGPREFYHSDDHTPCPVEGSRFDAVLRRRLPARAHRYVETMLHSDLATEPARTSSSYGLQNYLMNDPRYMLLYSIEGGNQQLPSALEQRIDARKLLEHRVTSIGKQDDGKLRVTAVHEGQLWEESFDFVVLALPHNALNRLDFQGTRLAAAMESHLAHYNHPAHYLRMSLLFDRPYWRQHLQDSFCMLDAFGGCCLYDESSREPGIEQGVLGWLVSGAAAEEMSDWDDAALIEAALHSLPTDWGNARERWLEGKVHRWNEAINAIPGGLAPRSLDLRHQPEPVEHPHLFVVGDYLFDATLNGVLDSADYVSEWLTARMTEN